MRQRYAPFPRLIVNLDHERARDAARTAPANLPRGAGGAGEHYRVISGVLSHPGNHSMPGTYSLTSEMSRLWAGAVAPGGCEGPEGHKDRA